jgi:DNA polymerase (family 10)
MATGPSLSNAEIAEVLDRYGVMLQLAGESPFRSRAYTRAAESVRAAREPVAMLLAQDSLSSLPGVGQGLAAAIAELVRTGSYQPLVELEAVIPGTLIELLSIPGVGLKTALRLYQELGVTDLETLAAALESGQIEQTRGLGKRTAATVRSGIESVKRRTGRLRLGTALPIAREFVRSLQLALPEAQVSIAGGVRRFTDTVADIDIVIATTQVEAARDAIAAMPQVAAALQSTADHLRLRLQNGVEVDIFWSSPERFGSSLVRATGPAGHVALLGSALPEAATEDGVYASLDLPWIPPELRHGATEIERASEIASLVKVTDINGEFHCHTTWSDGSASVAEMAAAAAARGYRFLAISDHSHGLGVANGLSPERLTAQRHEINSVNASGEIRLFAGTEVEVHRDGRLDFDDATLASLDVVVASLHVGLQHPREQLTDRLLGVLANPNVDIIAHPSGRLIEQREGGDFDWDRVFAAAAKSGTALEINADPARLDLTSAHAERALQAGCLLTINCDAHSPGGFSLMEFGIAVARRAWARPDQILNCWPLDRIVAWLAARDRTPAT